MRRTAVNIVTASVALLMGLALLVGPTTTSAASSMRGAAADAIVHGRVVNGLNGKPLRNIVVRIHDVVTLDVIARTTTNAKGRFRLNGGAEEEFGVFVNGTARGFEKGWLKCDGDTLARRWGAACSHGTEIGAIYIHRN